MCLGKAFPSTFQVQGMYSQHVGEAKGCGAVTLNLDYMLGSPRRLCNIPTSGLYSRPDDQTQPGFETTSTEEHS